MREGPLGIKQEGSLTFGAQLDLAALALGDGALFAKVLTDLPSATLKFATSNLSELELSLLNQYFGQDGLSERISLFADEEAQGADKFYDTVDVVLASVISRPEDIAYPLQMSVPVIMRDRTNVKSGYGSLILSAAERGEWQVSSDEEFIALASSLSDFAHLGEVRQALKTGLPTTKLFDSNTNTLEFMYAMLSACDRVKALKGEEKVAADDAN